MLLALACNVSLVTRAPKQKKKKKKEKRKRKKKEVIPPVRRNLVQTGFGCADP
jgi:hypothetical protein